MKVALISLYYSFIIISLTDKNIFKNHLFRWVIICDYRLLFILVRDYLFFSQLSFLISYLSDRSGTMKI